MPDLCLITAQQRQEIENSAAVLESIPLLIVEVVSPESVKRYEQKKDEYQAKKIPEYWIVDPLTDKVSILLLVNNHYESTFTASQQIISLNFPELVLTDEQVFQA